MPMTKKKKVGRPKRKALERKVRDDVPTRRSDPPQVVAPSPAWEKLRQKAKPAMAKMFPGLYREAGVEEHEKFLPCQHPPERQCPGCIAPSWCVEQPGGWPIPCRVRITPNVECRDTAAAATGARHHWDCTYWDHYSDDVPF
jgi:hypothetical protein